MYKSILSYSPQKLLNTLCFPWLWFFPNCNCKSCQFLKYVNIRKYVVTKELCEYILYNNTWIYVQLTIIINSMRWSITRSFHIITTTYNLCLFFSYLICHKTIACCDFSSRLFSYIKQKSQINYFPFISLFAIVSFFLV